MKALFAAVLVLACVAGSTNGFARGRSCRLCTRRRWLCPPICAVLCGTGAADAHLRKPDSRPARGSRAGPRHQRPDVAALPPRHVTARGVGSAATGHRTACRAVRGCSHPLARAAAGHDAGDALSPVAETREPMSGLIVSHVSLCLIRASPGRGSRDPPSLRANMIAGPISSLRFTQTGDFVHPSTLLLRLRGITVCRSSRSVVTTPKPILNPLHCIQRRPPRKMYPHERTNPSESWRWRTMVRKRSSTQIRQDTSGKKRSSTPWPIIRRRALRPKRSSARR